MTEQKRKIQNKKRKIRKFRRNEKRKIRNEKTEKRNVTFPKSHKLPVSGRLPRYLGASEVRQRGTGAEPRYVPGVHEVKPSRTLRKSVPIHHVRWSLMWKLALSSGTMSWEQSWAISDLSTIICENKVPKHPKRMSGFVSTGFGQSLNASDPTRVRPHVPCTDMCITIHMQKHSLLMFGLHVQSVWLE